ncbi:FAD/NADP-binding domain-containing protein [Dacryopinax primogenitus]|uniref:FAD/NADP-binding domain-containing protein n=1 Tax=Dacryopinax primogenitus (strain DJM 731) TaxID=1858805 RepID=M5GFA1_DACPD|nr:FAD/NADP-binding domain-containing protein [Dacryopinax primogenitus]EJU06087.1 FAD/NADP-binding domain-containing protein [Dacryopinax primogenitus]
MTLPAEVDVLVVGAGPTGLTCASSILTHGVPVNRMAIVDAPDAGNMIYSRALVVHSKTLEAMEKIGCTEGVVAAGHPHQLFHFNSLSSPNGPLITLKASLLQPWTKYAFFLVIAQCDTERVLMGRLKELLGEEDIRWGKRVVDVRETEEGWKVASFEDGQQVRARYVVGADGGHSVVRQSAGIAFPDPYNHTAQSTPEPADIDHPSKADEVFCLADVRITSPISSGNVEEFNAYLTPSGVALWIPLGDGVYRMGGQVLSGSAPKEPDQAYLQQLLSERILIASGATITEVLWSSRFHIKFRLAERYWVEHLPGTAVQRDGKTGVILVGDAAHVHSPMGKCLGMNLGIRDSITLGQALSHALSPAVSPTEARTLLTRWARDRHTEGSHVIALSGRLTWVSIWGSALGAWTQKARDWLLWGVVRVPGVMRVMVWNLSGLGEKDTLY